MCAVACNRSTPPYFQRKLGCVEVACIWRDLSTSRVCEPSEAGVSLHLPALRMLWVNGASGSRPCQVLWLRVAASTCWLWYLVYWGSGLGQPTFKGIRRCALRVQRIHTAPLRIFGVSWVALRLRSSGVIFPRPGCVNRLMLESRLHLPALRIKKWSRTHPWCELAAGEMGLTD